MRTQKELHKSFNSTGFKYAINLFRCALLCYYDRFHNFDIKVVNKLFLRSLMLRVDMESLGYESINKYTIGESNGRYTNEIPIFYLITNSRLHNEISNLHIKTKRDKDLARVDKWNDLYLKLNEINGLEIEYEK